MIYLNFPESREMPVEFAKIEKPHFTKEIKEVMLTTYSESLALDYSKLVDDFLYKNMDFPEDGLYKIENGYFWRYEKNFERWVNTNRKENSYVIYADNEIWSSFDKKFKFLRIVRELLLETVQKLTEEMLCVNDWKKVTSIEFHEKEVVCGYFDSLSEILCDYFNKNKVEEIEMKIRKLLFSSERNDFLILSIGYTEDAESMRSAKRYAMYKDKIDPFKAKSLKKLENWLAESLEVNDRKTLLRQIKNLVCYGIFSEVDIDKYREFEVKRFLLDNEFYGWFMKATEEVLSAIDCELLKLKRKCNTTSENSFEEEEEGNSQIWFEEQYEIKLKLSSFKQQIVIEGYVEKESFYLKTNHDWDTGVKYMKICGMDKQEFLKEKLMNSWIMLGEKMERSR